MAGDNSKDVIQAPLLSSQALITNFQQWMEVLYKMGAPNEIVGFFVLVIHWATRLSGLSLILKKGLPSNMVLVSPFLSAKNILVLGRCQR